MIWFSAFFWFIIAFVLAGLCLEQVFDTLDMNSISNLLIIAVQYSESKMNRTMIRNHDMQLALFELCKGSFGWWASVSGLSSLSGLSGS